MDLFVVSWKIFMNTDTKSKLSHSYGGTLRLTRNDF